jgi:hypothetical protein
MKKLLVALSLGLAACSNMDGAGPMSGPDTSKPGPGMSKPPPDMSNPPPDTSKPAEGYTRFSPEPIELAAGEEGIWCQWVAGPAEADTDIVDITGEQLFPGHHAILFATPMGEPAGTTRLCNDADQAQMKLLGGVGGEGSGTAFPTGAVVRLKKGQSLMMNTHYLNTSDKKVMGRATLDVKLAEPSPDHVLASFFGAVGLKFALMPQSESTLDVTCVLPRDIKLIDWSNHMHDLGVKIHSEVIHADSTAEDLQRDQTWQYEWQFNPPRRKWPVDAPHVLKAGDTLHTQCNWKNTSAEMLTFPREMCVASGFFLGEEDLFCVDGNWPQ